MRGVIADLEDREHSINCLLDHVEEVSNTKGKIDIIVVLKSSIFIALYNNIEATTYATLEKIHNDVSQLQYTDLIEPLRKKCSATLLGKQRGPS